MVSMSEVRRAEERRSSDEESEGEARFNHVDLSDEDWSVSLSRSGSFERSQNLNNSSWGASTSQVEAGGWGVRPSFSPPSLELKGEVRGEKENGRETTGSHPWRNGGDIRISNINQVETPQVPRQAVEKMMHETFSNLIGIAGSLASMAQKRTTRRLAKASKLSSHSGSDEADYLWPRERRVPSGSWVGIPRLTNHFVQNTGETTLQQQAEWLWKEADRLADDDEQRGPMEEPDCDTWVSTYRRLRVGQQPDKARRSPRPSSSNTMSPTQEPANSPPKIRHPPPTSHHPSNPKVSDHSNPTVPQNPKLGPEERKPQNPKMAPTIVSTSNGSSNPETSLALSTSASSHTPSTKLPEAIGIDHNNNIAASPPTLHLPNAGASNIVDGGHEDSNGGAMSRNPLFYPAAGGGGGTHTSPLYTNGWESQPQSPQTPALYQGTYLPKSQLQGSRGLSDFGSRMSDPGMPAGSGPGRANHSLPPIPPSSGEQVAHNLAAQKNALAAKGGRVGALAHGGGTCESSGTSTPLEYIPSATDSHELIRLGRGGQRKTAGDQ